MLESEPNLSNNPISPSNAIVSTSNWFELIRHLTFFFVFREQTLLYGWPNS